MEAAIGKVSARGQVAIPADLREKMRLKEGEKVLFVLEGNTLIVKPIQSVSWEEITEPLRKAKKKIREDQVVDFIHEMRRKRRESSSTRTS
jgi:AbrB family looped-hinge helix DNA binding protein